MFLKTACFALKLSRINSLLMPLSAHRYNPHNSHLGCHEQANPFHAALLPHQRGQLRELQRHWQAAGVSGSGPRAHHHCLEVAGR